MTVRINKQKINLREKLTEFEDKVNFDEVVRGLGEYTENVGIGVEDPSHLLHIKSIGAGDFAIEGTQPRIWLKETDQTDLDILMRNHAGQFRIDVTEDNGNLVSTPFLINNTNGDVGIGTTNPGAKLEIQGTSANSEYLRVGGANASANRALRFSSFNSGADDSGHIINAPSSGGVIQFQTSSANVMRIDSDGNVGIGTTNPGKKLVVESDQGDYVTKLINKSADPFGLSIEYTADKATQTNDFIRCFKNTSDIRFRVYSNGTVLANTTEYTSDDRVKHNEQPIVGAIETIGKLAPKKYIKTADMYEADHDFELDADGNPVDGDGEPVEHSVEAGVIAQQVLEVPELAFIVSPEGVDEDGNVTSPHGLNYNSLFTYAIAAIQEQQSIIEDLKSRIETLESK